MNNFLGHSGWCMNVIISSFENNLVKFSFENNLVILGGIVFGDILCVIVKATNVRTGIQ